MTEWRRGSGRRPWLVAMVVAALAACTTTPQLIPGEAAEIDAGPGVGAVEQVAGVRIEARSQAWQWRPENLESVLTPLLVDIRNDGERPLRIRYSELRLRTADGRTLHALPPFDIEAEVTEALPAYPYPVVGFHVAPHLHPHFTTFHVGHPFDHRVGYYHDHYPMWREIDLPTQDMLTRALPEGVLEPGGSIQGFVYFEPLGQLEDGASTVTFQFDMVDATSERSFASVAIPFRVVRDRALFASAAPPASRDVARTASADVASTTPRTEEDPS